MAEIIPQGQIRLMKNVPLSSDYINTFWFNNDTDQATHFTSQYAYFNFDKEYYQRKNRGWLRVKSPYKNVYNCNYMMFKNAPALDYTSHAVARNQYEDKWWYAFIDKVVYINDNVTEIHYTIDVIQSYLFDVIFEDTYIERLTPESDVAGDNMIDEEIPIGDYAYAVTGELAFEKEGTSVGGVPLHQDMHPVAAATCTRTYQDTTDGASITNQEYGNGIINGCLMIDPVYNNSSQDPAVYNAALKNWIDNMPGEKYGAILGITMVPLALRNGVSADGTGTPVNTVGHLLSQQISKPTRLGSYQPVNKKLLTYPYNCLMITSSDGASQCFAYELFNKNYDYVQFRLDYVYTFPLQGVLYPHDDYKSQHLTSPTPYRAPYVMALPQLPTCTWSNDTFKAWAAMNTGYTALSIAGSVMDMATVVGGALLGGALVGAGKEVLASGAGRLVSEEGLIPFGTEASGDVPYTITGRTSSFGTNMSDTARQIGGMRLVGDIMNITKNIINVHNAKIIPDSFNGSSSNLATVAASMYGFHFTQRCVRADYAKQIDNYFTMFGYAQKKIMTIKLQVAQQDPVDTVAGLKNRRRFTYIKTSNMDVRGAIPSDDKVTFCEVFNSGVRFWFDKTTVGDYMLANPVIT